MKSPTLIEVVMMLGIFAPLVFLFYLFTPTHIWLASGGIPPIVSHLLAFLLIFGLSESAYAILVFLVFTAVLASIWIFDLVKAVK